MKKIHLFCQLLLCIALFARPSFAATTIPFTINMSEAVNVTGTPRIPINVGGNPDGNARYATYTTGTGTSTLTFTYTMIVGDVDLDGVTLSSPIQLNSGTIKDLNGNDATLTFTVPNTSNVKVSYPSLSMDFVNNRYTLNGMTYNSLASFLTPASGTFSRSSTATYFDSSGIIQTASSGSPRFDYDPTTLTAKGLLLEENRTNSLLRSEEIENAAWGKSNSTISANVTTAPDGFVTADKLIENNDVNLSHNIGQSAGAAGNTYYTGSFYVKAAERSRIVVWFRGGSSANRTQVGFDLTGSGSVFAIGTVGNFTNGTAKIASIPGGWYKCSVTAQTGAGEAAIRTNIQLLNTTSGVSINANYNGDGVSGAYVWGIQSEQGTFATSYIKTTTASVTRQADSLSIPTGSWYNSSAGTFMNDVSWTSSSGTSYPMFFRVDDTTNNERWNAYYNQGVNSLGIDGYTGAVSQGFSSAASSTSGTAKIASAQSSNSTNFAFNGTLKTLDTSWTPPTVTRLILDGSNAQKWHSLVKYYPLRAIDAQLPLLTQ